MGRQSFLAENQKFQKIHFYHLSPSECVYIHQNGTQRHQLISYENIYHCGSFWGYLTGKKLILRPKLLKNTTEKRPKIRKIQTGPILSYKLRLVALSSSHMYTKMMNMGHRMGFWRKSSGFWPFQTILPKKDPRIAQKHKKHHGWCGLVGKVRPSKAQ